MLKVSFSSPSVSAYCSGRDNQLPLQVAVSAEVKMQQTHGNTVAVVTTPKDQVIKDCDAVITNLHQVALKVRHADCLPILMYHPSGVIATIHAGRKGTELKITQVVLKKLQSDFNITDSLEMWFGPAICAACYQIDQATDLHYDLIKKNTDQVRSLFSESQAQIQYSSRCTAHENQDFYSYRKEGKGVPMNWSGIALFNQGD